MDTNTLYAILGIGAMVMVTVGIIFLSRLKASISTKGVEIDGSKAERANDKVVIKGIKKSKLAVSSREKQDVHIEDVSDKTNLDVK